MSVAPGTLLRVIAPEDIVIDCLCAAKFWRDADSRGWAADILRTALRLGREFDLPYLKRRAGEEDVADELAALLKQVPDNGR